MFSTENQEIINVEQLIKAVEQSQLGLQVLKVKKFSLPIEEYTVSLQISKRKAFNVLEEFILKLALTDIGEPVDIQTVQSVLGVDKVFIEYYLKSMCATGTLDSAALPVLKMTKEGKERYDTGYTLTVEKQQNVKAFIHPEFHSVYETVPEYALYDAIEEYHEFEYGECLELTAQLLESRQELLTPVAEFCKGKNILFEKESINQYISSVSRVVKTGEQKQLPFIELWLYDLVEDRVFCKVIDLCNDSYHVKLEEYLMKEHPLTREEFQIDSEEIERAEQDRNLYEEEYRSQLSEQRETAQKGVDVKSKASGNQLRMVRGAEIKKEFTRALKSVKKYLLIQSPWISGNAMDEEMLTIMQKLLDQKCAIFISWGYAREMEKENRLPAEELLARLQNMKTPDGLPGVFIYWVGNHHDKEIIVDDKEHYLGSFNWLSYRGDYLPRGESVYITTEKGAVWKAKQYWESQLFETIAGMLWNEEYIRNLCALLHLQTTESEVQELIIREVTEDKLCKSEEFQLQVYNMLVIMFQSRRWDELFIYAANQLLSLGLRVTEIFTMMMYDKANSKSDVYEQIFSVHQTLFEERELMSKDGKVKADIKKKIKNLKMSVEVN